MENYDAKFDIKKDPLHNLQEGMKLIRNEKFQGDLKKVKNMAEDI